MLQETAVAWPKYYPGIGLEGLRKTHRTQPKQTSVGMLYLWVWKTFTDVSEEGTSYSFGLVFKTEDRGTKFLLNVDKHLSDYTT
jgi:hypothetical protein